MDPRSEKNLAGVHPDLVRIVRKAAELHAPYEFIVICGLRTLAEQKRLVAQGKSQTLHSRHLTGHAVDIVPVIDGAISWDVKYYRPICDAMSAAAEALGLPIEHGADWKSFHDWPHHQLPWSAYP
jgi:hypothetical protein